MGSTGTRPPLFDPEPGSFDRDVDSPRFPRKPGKRAGKGKKDDTGADSNNSPAWVRPFIFGGLILVAILSLFSFLGAGEDPESTAADGQDPVDDSQAEADVQPQVAEAVAVGQEDRPADGPAEPDQAATGADEAQPDEADASSSNASRSNDAEAAPVASVDQPTELQGASAFAVQFANDYLNFDESNPDVRERKLRSYLAPGLDGQLGWDGQGVQLAVLTVPVQADVTATGVSVTVAAQITGKNSPRWVHLMVPVAADQAGRWAVTAQPAYVPRPVVGAVNPATEPSVDDALTEELGPGIKRLFASFAQESAVQLEGITTTDSAIRGLGGMFTLDTVKQISVFTGDGDTRTARSRVTWQDPVTGTTVDQTYTLTLVQDGDAWLIDQIGVG